MYSEVDLRKVNYVITGFPANILYLADYHQQKCVSPGGNDAHLYFKEATSTDVEIKQCRRMTINGWEKMDASANLS